VAKRRRTIGSPDEAPPPGQLAPVAFGSASPRPVEPDLPLSATERTEIMDPPAPRLPTSHLNAGSGPGDGPARKVPRESPPIGDAAISPPQALPGTPLEMRIRRLEDALAQLQIRRDAEQRVTAQPAKAAIPAIPVAIPVNPPPPAQAPTDKLWEMGKRVLNAPVEVARTLASPPGSSRSRQAWLLSESVAEARAIVRMYTDPRYRLSWTARILPPLLLVAFVASWWWVPFTSFAVVGTLLNKVIDLLVAFVLIKLLGHEARRYRETAPDLPPSLRL
jgi:hypothetical protein